MSTHAQDIAAQINKTLGTEAIMLGSDERLVVEYLPTGVLPFDWLIGGGLPRGRFIEVYGDYSTLKSYIAYKAMASVIEAGGTAAVIDTERAWDPYWAEALGMDTDRAIVTRVETGEQAIAAADIAIRNGVDLLVWDSIAATLPMAEHEKAPTEDRQPARQALMMSRGLRRLTAANSRTAVLAINQTRVNVGMTFGSPVITPGGKSMPFYASQRVQLIRAGKVTYDKKQYVIDKDETTKVTTGFKIKAVLQKSKLSKPFSETWFLFDLADAEVDDVGWLITMGLEIGTVTRPSKTKWEISDLGFSVNGRQNFYDAVRDDQEAIDYLYQQVMEPEAEDE